MDAAVHRMSLEGQPVDRHRTVLQLRVGRQRRSRKRDFTATHDGIFCLLVLGAAS